MLMPGVGSTCLIEVSVSRTCKFAGLLWPVAFKILSDLKDGNKVFPNNSGQKVNFHKGDLLVNLEFWNCHGYWISQPLTCIKLRPYPPIYKIKGRRQNLLPLEDQYEKHKTTNSQHQSVFQLVFHLLNPYLHCLIVYQVPLMQSSCGMCGMIKQLCHWNDLLVSATFSLF